MTVFATAEVDSNSGCGVVTKEIIGKSARGLLDYIGNPKKTGSDRPFHTNFSGSSPRDIAREFSFLRQLKPNLSRAVSHIIVSVPEIGDDPVLWRRVVDETLRNKGYEECLFASFIHTDTNNRHVHIFVSRIFVNPKTGKTEVVSDSRNFEKNIESSRKLEKSLGIAPLVEKPIEERPYASGTKHKAERRESRLQSEKSESKFESIQPERKTVEAKYVEIAEHASKSLEGAENPTQWKTEFERRLADAGLPGTVEFHHRGEEVSGWSLLLPGGSQLKGSSISRTLGFGQVQKKLLANAEEARARRRRLARAGETMDASIVLASIARPASQTVLGQAPGPLADPGVQAAGFQMLRQETDEGQVYYQYLDEGGEVAFQDQDSILIFAQNDNAVLAAVKLAVQRHGPILDCAGSALQDSEFRRRLVMAACAVGAQIRPLEAEIALRQQALGAASAEKLKTQAKPASGLGFLDFPPGVAANDGDEDDDGSDPAAGGGGGTAAGGAPAAPVIPAVPAADDVAARISRAQQVLKMVLPGPPPRPAQAEKMSVLELTERAQEWAGLEPLVQWHSVTAARLQSDTRELGGQASASDRVLLKAESRARLTGLELPTAVSRREHREAKEKLQAALDQPLGVLQRFGLGAREREEELEALRAAERRARERSVSLRAAFDAEEKNQAEARALQQRLAMHSLEHQALHAVAWAAQAFSSWLKKFWDLVKGAMARDARQASQRREIDALVEQAGGGAAAADDGTEGQGDGATRHERQR